MNGGVRILTPPYPSFNSSVQSWIGHAQRAGHGGFAPAPFCADNLLHGNGLRGSQRTSRGRLREQQIERNNGTQRPMSDIFISYANKDRRRASRLAEALSSEGWSVFWDRTILAGQDWREFIGSELEKARCVLVAWSEASVKSQWVKEEAEDARVRKILVPVFFDDVRPPLGFRHIQAENLVDWNGRPDAPDYQRLIDAIETKVPRPETREPIETPTRRGPKVFRDALADGSKGPGMIRIPDGEFEMGDLHGDGHADERPVHTVSIHALAIGCYAVTFEAYDRFAEATGRERPDDTGWGRGRRPVINVSWRDAVAYAEWLSQQTGKRYRLPTEAEWEYAARAGTSTSYWWGDEVGENRANFRGSGSQWDGRQTAPVGSMFNVTRHSS